jgi:hypothetical protein
MGQVKVASVISFNNFSPESQVCFARVTGCENIATACRYVPNGQVASRDDFDIFNVVAYYEPRDDELFESADLIIAGEDLDDVGSDSGADQVQEKPVRVLTDFSIFDPKHRNEMMSLSAIEQEDSLDRQFEGAGLVAPYLINEEDEGQEDGLDAELQYVRLGAILRYTLDYAEENE